MEAFSKSQIKSLPRYQAVKAVIKLIDQGCKKPIKGYEEFSPQTAGTETQNNTAKAVWARSVVDSIQA